MKCEHGNDIIVLLEIRGYWDDGIKQYGEQDDELKIIGCEKCKFIKFEVK